MQSDQVGWKCESCRKSGLERARRCGFLDERECGAPRIVWARWRASTDRCPVSTVTAESIGWIERHAVWKRLGAIDAASLRAREVDALCVIEEEMSDGGTRT